MNREQVIRTWAGSGINDFFLEHCLPEAFYFQKPFFYFQGLEKLCKAYILGLESAQYEHLPENESKDAIDKIARKYSHNLIKLIRRVIEEGVFEEDTLTKKYVECYGYELIGEDIARLLMAGYTECRYPVKENSSKNYPIPNSNGHWIPLHSSGPDDFAYSLGRILNERIERDFQVSTFNDLSSRMISYERDNWIRFCRIFYEKKL